MYLHNLHIVWYHSCDCNVLSDFTLSCTQLWRGICSTFPRGYYPKGGGEVVVRMSPVKQLDPINLTDRGSVTKIYGRAFVAGVLPLKVSCLGALRSVWTP